MPLRRSSCYCQVSNLSNSVADLMRQQANANAEAAKQEALLQVGG